MLALSNFKSGLFPPNMLMNILGRCGACGKKEFIKIVGLEREEEETEETITYQHVCTLCGHLIAKHEYHFIIAGEYQVTEVQIRSLDHFKWLKPVQSLHFLACSHSNICLFCLLLPFGPKEFTMVPKDCSSHAPFFFAQHNNTIRIACCVALERTDPALCLRFYSLY